MKIMFRFLIISIFICVSLAGAQSLPVGEIWNYPVPFSTTNVVAGNYGASVFTRCSIGSRGYILSGFSINPVSPLQNMVGDTGFYSRVSSAKTSDLAFEIYNTYDAGLTGYNQVVIKRRTLSDVTNDWTYFWPTLTNGHDKFAIFTSDDGNKTVALVYNSLNGFTDIKVFGPNSPQPILQTSVNGILNSSALSADGSTLLVHYGLSIKLINTSTGAVVHSNGDSQPLATITKYWGNTSISGDGSVFALGRFNRVDIYRKNSSGNYSYYFSLNEVGSAQGVVLSADGTTLAAGFVNSSTVTVKSADIYSQTILTSKIYNGSGSLSNGINTIAISNDGSVFAVGMWGDESNTVPQLAVFSRNTSTPIFEQTYSGSVNDLSLTPDKKYVAVSTREHHMSTTSYARNIRLVRVSPADIFAQGTQQAGTNLQINLTGIPGRNATVLMSHSLATNPQTFPQMGTLHVNRADITVISAGTFDAQGRATATITLPVTVGTELFFQKLETGNLQPRRLGEDFVKVQIVP